MVSNESIDGHGSDLGYTLLLARSWGWNTPVRLAVKANRIR